MEKYKERNGVGKKARNSAMPAGSMSPTSWRPARKRQPARSATPSTRAKRWFFDEPLYAKLAGTGKVRQVVCPTCRKIKDIMWRAISP